MFTEAQALIGIEQNLNEEISLHPRWPDLWNRLGQIYAYKGAYAEAVECFEKANQINQTFAIPFANRLFSLYKAGRKKEAAEFITTVPPALQQDVLWSGASGWLLFHLDNFSEAHQRLTFTIDKDHQSALWYHYRWLVNVYLNQMEAAHADLAMAIQLCPSLPRFLTEFDLTAAHFPLASVKKYVAQFEMNRYMAAVCHEIGQVYFSDGQFDEALKHFDRAVRFDLYPPNFHIKMGQIYSHQGKDEEAYQQYEIAVQLAPLSVPGNMHLANEEVLRGNIAKALEIYALLVANYPKFADLRYYFSVLYSDLGHLDHAIEQFEAALQINPNYNAPRVGLAFCLLRAHRYKEALDIYQQVIEHGMASADVYLQIGNIHGQLQQYDYAYKAFEQAYLLDPSYPSILYYWGLACQENKDPERARHIWTRYLHEDLVGVFAEKVKTFIDGHE